MVILGLNESHTATATLMVDGRIVACASEERFTRQKGGFGYPRLAIAYCLREAGIRSEQIDRVIIGYRNPGIILHDQQQVSSSWFHRFLSRLGPVTMRFLRRTCVYIPLINSIYEWLFYHVYAPIVWPRLRARHRVMLQRELGISSERIEWMDHHDAHAFAAAYSYPNATNEPLLVIINDGIGDRDCGSVYEVRSHQWNRIAGTPNKASLAYIYQYTTELLGMKPNEHEYKVMGLAPYAHQSLAREVYPIFDQLIINDDLAFTSRIPTLGYYYYLRRAFTHKRFDAIAGALQRLVEQRVTRQLENAIQKTGIRRVAVGGGLFMNIKANMELATVKNLEQLWVMPTASDESTAIGACYYGQWTHCQHTDMPFEPIPLSTLYLGPAVEQSTLSGILDRWQLMHPNQYQVTVLTDPAEQVAELLESGSVVARCSGRMEYGARALGNRSIFADPRNNEVVKIINGQIKGRDFWMPFAPIILDERREDYLVDSPAVVYSSAWMMAGWHTRERAWTDMPACLHAADRTARPQLLSQMQNPEVYQLLKAFERRTGVGALLNTSFNIHGEPIVCTAEEALDTLHRSGLRYLWLSQYLVRKIDSYGS